MPRFLDTVRAALVAAADPARAPKMQAYMKSPMPYHGVASPALTQVCRALLPAHPVTTEAAWRRDVLELWRGARFREERYVAITLTGDKRARAFQTPAAMDLYEEMIVDGAWWDYVDAIAVHRVGPILDAHRAKMRPLMLRWSKSEDMWKRRTSIICQVAAKDKIDLELLYACIEPSLPSKEFFLRKAIGWALRQHAWRDPAEVQRYLAEKGDALSPLSRREALINIEGRRKKR
jgi:3-methyladenine DNA glycosylase AlkD